jgi:rod shape-determining protein MreC
MESFFTRYRNPAILALILLAQVLGLAVQVKRPVDPGNPDAGSVRLLRSWVVGALTPVEKIFVSSSRFLRGTWHDYINVVGLRAENRELREQNEKLHLELARQADSANQAQRLQALLEFKQRFLSTTIAAQVIGSSGSEVSRLIYIDKGSRDGIKPEMAVITPHGIVGKVRDVYRHAAQVLMINDASSGVGAILEQSRVHGVVKGTPTGEMALVHIMADERIAEGERLVTSGGDRIFPKGLPVGTVAEVSPGPDLFLNVRIKPAANLSRLEEVLVITEMQRPDVESADAQTPVRAADILAQRLPSVPKKPEATPAIQQKATQGQNAASQTQVRTAKPVVRPPGAAGDSAGSAPDTVNRVSPKPRAAASPSAAKPKTEAPSAESNPGSGPSAEPDSPPRDASGVSTKPAPKPKPPANEKSSAPATSEDPQ